MKKILSVFTLLLFFTVSTNAYGYSPIYSTSLVSAAVDASSTITNFLRPCSKTLVSISESMFSRNYILSPAKIKSELQRNLDKLKEKNPMVTCCYAAFPTCKAMLLSPSAQLPDGYDPSSRPWYSGAVENPRANFVQPVYVDALNGHSLLSMSKAITGSKGGKLIGVAGVDYDISVLLAGLQSTQPSSGTTIVVFDRNQNVVVSNDNNIKAGFPMATLTETSSLDKYGIGFKLDFKNLACNGYLHREPVTGWSVLALIQE